MKNYPHVVLQVASRAFGERLPNDWQAMSDEDQASWLEIDRWTPFEGMSNDEYFALIDAHGDAIHGVIREVLAGVKGKLIEAAIECELPSDFNELDLMGMIDNEMQ